ncbi:MAG TPA: glutaminyl-peptide cyclotransferase, partial [Thermoanaerobaculia bacterium]|nr:glutaminyl-peptide cyclotransferase [Thermoanaerobaculia bacterium]
ALLSAWFLFRPAPAPARADRPVLPAAPGVERLALQVVATRPHDRGAFTQGLVWHQGKLYESTGQYGGSSLRVVEPETGRVERKLDLASNYFAEGLALAGDRLIQITWMEQVAFVYNLADLSRVGEFRYTGEGWGLAFDGQNLIMSDGSDRLTFRDPRTFAAVREVRVKLGESPVHLLNELEWVDGKIYANIWQSEEIVRIDPRTGRVEAVIDASGLLTPEERYGTDVLNGIAYVPSSKTFLITGKLWPKMFEVKLVPRRLPSKSGS